jgi:hypothetical protein
MMREEIGVLGLNSMGDPVPALGGPYRATNGSNPF